MYIGYMYALPVVWPYLQWALQLLFARRNTYRTSEEEATVKRVMQAAFALPWKHVDGVQRIRNMTLPRYIVTPTLYLTVEADRIGMDGELHARVDVLRWRWSPPLIPVSPYCAPPKPDTIAVLERYDNHIQSGVTSTSEVVLPHGFRASMREYLQRIAEEILELYRERKYQGIVVVLHGLPGVGKSNVARLLTKLLETEQGLESCLYPQYSATRPGDCFTQVVRPYAETAHVVLVCDEFDTCLTSIKDQTVETNDEVRPDATDKASWNGLLDAVHRKLNTILVLTTNATPEVVRTQCAIDDSMVRGYRVDMWREVSAVDGPSDADAGEVDEPATPSESSEVSLPLLDLE